MGSAAAATKHMGCSFTGGSSGVSAVAAAEEGHQCTAEEKIFDIAGELLVCFEISAAAADRDRPERDGSTRSRSCWV